MNPSVVWTSLGPLLKDQMATREGGGVNRSR
jgi:hypothetical protein